MNDYAEKLDRKRNAHERIILDTCEIQEDAIVQLAYEWIKKILELEL